jgi:N-acetylmuramoyl-L-alanine amidase
MDFNEDDKELRRRKLIKLAVLLIIACVIIALAVFLITYKELWSGIFDPAKTSPTPTNSEQVTESGNPNASGTPMVRSINILFENETIIFDGLTKDCEYEVVFENDKKFIFEQLKNEDDERLSSWYEINNKTTIYFTIDLDQYSLYEYDEKTLYPDDSVIQKIIIKKDDSAMTLNIEMITNGCVAISDINIESNKASYTVAEVKNQDFYNYSNIYSRKFMFIPGFQLCKQSDSTILFYEDNVDDGSDDIYSIRLNPSIKYDLQDEKFYINDDYIEYVELKKEVKDGVTKYLLSFALKKDLILYPNANDYFSTLTFCDGNMENVIVIDAGHGGHDPGAASRTDDGINEADINLAICQKIEQKLLAEGYTVFMTRNEDIYLGFVLERGDLTNIMNAVLFVSVHVDSYTEESAHGILSIWRDSDDKQYAQIIQNCTVLEAIAPNRDLMQQNLAIHGKTVCPAVTVEVGFMTNVSESASLKTDAYQDKLAQGISNGIIECMKIIAPAEE